MGGAGMNIVTEIEARDWAGRPAFHVDGRSWTHGAVHALSARVATVLAEHGVRPGSRVVLALPDGIAWVSVFLAVARLGAVAVLVNPDITADDHRYLTTDCEAVLCVSDASVEFHFDQAPWLDVDHLLVLAESSAQAAVQPVDGRTPLYVQYTSGTTGRPKGVVHCHGDLAVYAETVGAAVLGIGERDVALSVSKLFYAYGFGNALVFPLYSGSSAVLLDRRATPDVVAEAVARHGVTVLYAVPSAYAGLADVGERSGFRTLRAAVSAGEGMPAALGDRLTELFGRPVVEQIGSTEAGHAFCANTVWRNVPGSIGRPVPGFELELRDAAGTPLPDAVEGELWVRGPTLFAEYLNQPEQTARALVGGWLATRDLACRDGDGNYRHRGRVDDLEMVGGITMSPLEVERVLQEHPLVREAAVAAVHNEQGATKLRAFVVPVTPVADTAPLESELIAWTRRRLAAFKVPRTVRLVADLPRTPTGKLRRHLVRSGSW